MFDISKAEISIECPKCNFSNQVTLGDVQMQKDIVCGGCHRTIKLKDDKKTVRKAIGDVNKSVNDLTR